MGLGFMGDDRPIRRFRNQLAGFYFLRYVLFCLIFFAFSGGIIVLTTRVLFGRSLQGPAGAVLAGVALLAAFIYSLIRTLLSIPSVDGLRVVFDKINCCGGLLMTSSETDIGSWSQRISAIRSPSISWDGRCWGWIFLLAVIFLGFSFMVPQRYIMIHSAGRLQIDDQTQQLQEQIKVLEEENIIAEETAQDIRQKVDQIDETASGRDPVKTWEALGHLQDQLKKAAEEASVGMLAETEELTRTETLAKALNQVGAELDQQAMEGAMSELAQMTRSLMEQNEALKKMIGGQLVAGVEAGQLSPEQLQELMEALQGRKAELAQCTSRLCQADLAKMKLMQLCERKGQCNCEGLMALLQDCEGSQGAKDAVDIFMNNPNWDLDRGRGDAPMVWSDPSREQGNAFKEQVLPAASLAALKDSQLVGVSVSAPSIEDSTERLQSGNLSSAEAGSAQAVKQTVLPKHKAAVKGYFQREDKTE